MGSPQRSRLKLYVLYPFLTVQPITAKLYKFVRVSKYCLRNSDPDPHLPRPLNVTLPCCNYPFARNFRKECVVSCPQHPFSRNQEVGFAIFLYVITWITFVFAIVGLLPVFALTKWWKFPNYAFPIITSLPYLTSTWSMYVDRDDYLCEGYISFEDALGEFLKSPK